jgi:hypothetical protein
MGCTASSPTPAAIGLMATSPVPVDAISPPAHAQLDADIAKLVTHLGLAGAARDKVLNMSVESKVSLLQSHRTALPSTPQNKATRVNGTPNSAARMSMASGARTSPAQYLEELQACKFQDRAVLQALKVDLSTAPRDWMESFFLSRGFEELQSAVQNNLHDVRYVSSAPGVVSSHEVRKLPRAEVSHFA